MTKTELLDLSPVEVEKLLTRWVKEGKMTSKQLLGENYNNIKKMYATRELYVTSVDGIDVANAEIQRAFEILHEAKRIMTMREVMVRGDLTSFYEVNKTVREGAVRKFDILGKNAILFID